jgi:hypothetical protein
MKHLYSKYLAGLLGALIGKNKKCFRCGSVYSCVMPACLFCNPLKTVPDPGHKNIYWNCEDCGSEFVTSLDSVPQFRKCVLCVTRRTLNA